MGELHPDREHRAPEALTDPTELAAALRQALARPFSLRALWATREEFRRLEQWDYPMDPELQAANAILSYLGCQLDRARALLNQVPEETPARAYGEMILCDQNWQALQPWLERIVHRGWDPVPHLSITAGRPSVLNGFWDFSVHWTQICSSRSYARKLMRILCGSMEDEILMIAEAELLYQQNDWYRAMNILTGVSMTLSQKGDLQLLFASLAVQLSILVFSGQARSAIPMVQAVRAQLLPAQQEEWAPNLDALTVEAAMYDGDYAALARWMRDSAPDEFGEICILDLYCYLTKLRGYLIQEKYLAFTALAGRLQPYLEKRQRMMDLCQLHSLWAICDSSRGEGDSAMDHLEQALLLAERYRYDRILADLGERMLRLLLRFRRERGRSGYLDSLVSLSRWAASLYPRYLKPQLPTLPALSGKELVVLRFLAQGRSNGEIGELMDIRMNTVKVHCKNIYRKLEVRTRQQAVARGRELGILNEQF